jgi:hypothetical protein
MKHRTLVLVVVVGALLAGGLAIGAVQASASGPNVTYYACLAKGKLTHVGTSVPTCPSTATVISWNSQGPPGKDGANGTNGTNGTTGPPGPAGPGAVYIADTSNGTPITTDDVLASNVDGFNVFLRCGANINLDQSLVYAIWTNSNSNVGTVTHYVLSNSGGGAPAVAPQSGSFLDAPVYLANIDNISTGPPVTVSEEGYVIASSVGLGSNAEQGFWYTVLEQFQLTGTGTTGTCSVTGTLVPISGNRSVPLPIIVP